MKKFDTGFTFLETMIVIAIIAIVVSLATPEMISYVKNSRFNSEVHNLYSYLQNTRSLSIKNNKEITVQFNQVKDGKDTYVAFIDDDDDGALDNDETIILPLKEIEDDASFESITTSEQTPVKVTHIVYNALGFSKANAISSVAIDIKLQGYQENKATIRLNNSGNIGIE